MQEAAPDRFKGFWQDWRVTQTAAGELNVSWVQCSRGGFKKVLELPALLNGIDLRKYSSRFARQA
jgi:hypothetical protein